MDSISRYRRTFLPLLLGFAVTSLSAQATPASPSAVVRERFTSGIHATIYPASYLEAITQREEADTRGTIPLPDGHTLTVITDISDPAIVNKGDGEFHPFDVADVIELLSEIEFPGLGIDVEIFVLPFPRVYQMVSSTSGRTMFLSPHVAEISRENAAYIIAHEMGHVFHNRYLTSTDRWTEFRRVRGIEDESRYHESAPHADRPREIFAEDFRVLFGGPTAYFGGRVENTTIALPDQVPGLRPFYYRMSVEPVLAGTSYILGFSNYPNPFNPTTELVVDLSPELVAVGERLTLRIYDVRGALVRDLYAGVPQSLQVRVTWDGRDRHGAPVASAAYFGVAQAGSAKMTQKLLMVK